MSAESVLAAALIVAEENTAPILEQITNAVMTQLGHDAKGTDNTSKYVSMPGVDIAGWATSFIAAGVTTPPQIEKVGDIALTYP